MFPQTELCLWRDPWDCEHVTIGSVTRLSTALGSQRRYTAWVHFHIDALLFLADKRTYDRVRDARASEFPLPLELAVKIPPED